MEEKIVNDTIAYIKSLANSRKRNEEIAEKMVRESVSLTATEALDGQVIDLIAETWIHFLNKSMVGGHLGPK